MSQPSLDSFVQRMIVVSLKMRLFSCSQRHVGWKKYESNSAHSSFYQCGNLFDTYVLVEFFAESRFPIGYFLERRCGIARFFKFLYSSLVGVLPEGWYLLWLANTPTCHCCACLRASMLCRYSVRSQSIPVQFRFKFSNSVFYFLSSDRSFYMYMVFDFIN